MKKLIIIVAILFISISVLYAQDTEKKASTMNIEQWCSIRTGMTFKQCVNIIGYEGNCAKREFVDKREIRLYEYKAISRIGRTSSYLNYVSFQYLPLGYVFLIFDNGILKEIDVKNLPQNKDFCYSNSIDSETLLSQIDINMTYWDVVNLIGNYGVILNGKTDSKTSEIEVAWFNEACNTSIRLKFKNGKMTSKVVGNGIPLSEY